MTQTSRILLLITMLYANSDIDVNEMACEDILKKHLTPFGDSNFLLEEVDAFLALEDDPTSPEVDDSYYDPEGIFFLLNPFLNRSIITPATHSRKLFA
ncbi:hypothetical protein Tco_1353656 [Tanacetum coccineum]